MVHKTAGTAELWNIKKQAENRLSASNYSRGLTSNLYEMQIRSKSGEYFGQYSYGWENIFSTLSSSDKRRRRTLVSLS